MNVKQTDAIIAVGWGVMSLILVYDGLFDALWSRWRDGITVA